MQRSLFERVKIFVLLFVFVALLFPLNTQANDLGNHNKIFTPPSKMKSADWFNPDELRRVWDASLIRIPTGNGNYISAYMQDLGKLEIPARNFPTVIYLHGCAGVWSGTHTRLNFLAGEGFAVIAPQSFARAKYPQSCNLSNFDRGMYRGTLKMRQIDAEYAIEQAKKLSWVNSNNVFLMGLSQGGIATATFSSSSASTTVKARIIEGWTCHSGWQEYNGLNTSKSEPVLALIGKNDPWFRAPWISGDCGVFMNKRNGSNSVVFSKYPQSSFHALLEYPNVQQIALDFLHRQMQ